MSLASLTSRVEECEKREGDTEELKAMKANIAVLQTDMDLLKSTNINILWGTIEVDDPHAESIPTVPQVQPSRVEAEDEEIEIRSSDDEEDAERERSVEETYESLADLEDAAFQTAIDQTLRDTSTPTLSATMLAQGTDAPSSSTSAAHFSPSVVDEPLVVEPPVVDEPVSVESAGVKAHVVSDDPSAAGEAMVVDVIAPGIETRIDDVVVESAGIERDVFHLLLTTLSKDGHNQHIYPT